MSAQPSYYVDDLPMGFTEEDGVHAQTWQERDQADEETLRARGFTSDFCGAWTAFWSHIADKYGPALEAESVRVRALDGLPGEPCDRILERARAVYMAVMGAACRVDKRNPKLRRFQASAFYMEATRRGVSYDLKSMSTEDAVRLRSNLERNWRKQWTYAALVQRVIGLPLVERDRRVFNARDGKPPAAYYIDRLSDFINGIITEKNKAHGGHRLQRFEHGVAAVLTVFRNECEHVCRDGKDNRGNACQRPHLVIAPDAAPDTENPETEVKLNPATPKRNKVLPLRAATDKIADGIEIILDRARRGLLSAAEVEQVVMMFAPVVALVADTVHDPRMEAVKPYAEFETNPTQTESAQNAEFAPRASDEKCEFAEEKHKVEEVNADLQVRINSRQPDPPEVTLDDFLSALYPDSNEEIRLRFIGPRGIPVDEKGYPLEARFSTIKEGVTRAALQSNASLGRRLARLNETRGAYFVVNKGGDCDRDITRINAFFAECDEGTLEEQHAKFDACPVPPSGRVVTKKSVHGYWFAAPGQPVEKFRPVQIGLIRYFGSDEKIKNEARVMRMPFSNHIAYNAGLLDFKLVTVAAFDPSRRFTAAEMLAAFPTPPGAKPKPSREPKTLDELSGDFEDHKRELGWRIRSHQTAKRNGRGNWDCRGICHGGKGATGLFYNPARNFVICTAGCELAAIARAFGLSAYGKACAGGAR